MFFKRVLVFILAFLNFFGIKMFGEPVVVDISNDHSISYSNVVYDADFEPTGSAPDGAFVITSGKVESGKLNTAYVADNGTWVFVEMPQVKEVVTKFNQPTDSAKVYFELYFSENELGENFLKVEAVYLYLTPETFNDYQK